MTQPFKHDAVNLHDFFSQSGRGFYVPYYQRAYSWDVENAQKLIEDIFSSIALTLSKPNNSIFLGTVILHDEKDVKTGEHVDTPNLLTRVANVVDGQQRITSIAMLACVIDNMINSIAPELEALAGVAEEFQSLATELRDELPKIRHFYSVQIGKLSAQPDLKPKIIRAFDVSVNPVSDQWTLRGDTNKFYRSSTSVFLSKFIESGKIDSSLPIDDRVRAVLQVFKDKITEKINDVSIVFASGLLAACKVRDGSLSNFIAFPPDMARIENLDANEQRLYLSGLYLLALCSFLKSACHLVVIECLDLGLAFDMFQSLNATGTPLTAFEVFKPQIVKAWGAGYPTVIKPQVDRIEKVFEKEADSSKKEELTDRVIVSSALTFNGSERSRRFSEERDWLTDTLEKSLNSARAATDQSVSFVTCIADQAEYFEHFIQPRRPNRDLPSFRLCNHLQSMGLTTSQADRAALCVYFLKDAGHQFAHSVFSVFYSKLLRAQADINLRAQAALEFVEVCEATAAFFTLYMGAQQGRFPDSDYRALFQAEAGNISFANGHENQRPDFVKAAFRRSLASLQLYDADDNVRAKAEWVSNAKQISWYNRKQVCRFALFVSAHNAAPDLSPEKAGLFTDGQPNSADFLNCRAWHSSEFEVIEHVATRDKPANIKFSNHYDPAIYPGNYSVVDKLGNLTLLSRPVNSSIYSEWPDKAFYYWNLTTPSATAKGSDGTALAASLGIGAVPPALATLAAASSYLSHLAPLALRGQRGDKWDASFISDRSQHLCERVFDKLDPWLR